MKSLNAIDNTIGNCPNIHVFGLTPEGEEITQPCPTGRGFFGMLPSGLEIAQQQLSLAACLRARALLVARRSSPDLAVLSPLRIGRASHAGLGLVPCDGLRG